MKEEQDCKYCGGTGFDGFDREFPPNPYICTNCDSYERNQKNDQPPARQEGETPSVYRLIDPEFLKKVQALDLRTREEILLEELSAKQAELDALTKRHTRTAKWLEITSNEKGDLIDAHDAALAELESLKAAMGNQKPKGRFNINLDELASDLNEHGKQDREMLREHLFPTPPVERSENKG